MEIIKCVQLLLQLLRLKLKIHGHGLFNYSWKTSIASCIEDGLSSQTNRRFCVKHLYGNLRKKYPGEQMKQSLWIAARATTVP
ncbi:defensin/CCP-like protein, partial [Trifolium medium]|nr:defensin/CCP-like protein [Trifolium medium]